MKAKGNRQYDRVLRYMQTQGSITRAQAMNDIGVANLTAVIDYLRHRVGVPIKTNFVKGTNRYGEKITYANSSIEEENTMIKKLKADVEPLVLDEYKRATEQFGATHNSSHEACAVTFEEVIECDNALNDVKNDRHIVWGNTMANELSLSEWNKLKEDAINLACEAIQVAAMAYKSLQSFDDFKRSENNG